MRRHARVAHGSAEATPLGSPTAGGVQCRVALSVSAVTAFLLVGVSVWSFAASRHTRAPGPAAGHDLAQLPLAAQGPVSDALGRHERDYQVVQLRGRNPAQRLGLKFSRAGITVASAPARVRLRLIGFGYASTVRTVGAVTPRARVNRVR